MVTSFEFRLHPVSIVQFGPTFWPLEESATVLRAYRDFIQKAPETVSGFFAFLTVPPVPMFPENLHMRKVCGDRVVLHRFGAGDGIGARGRCARWAGRCSMPSGRLRFPSCRASSTGCTSAGCNGIGARTTSPS